MFSIRTKRNAILHLKITKQMKFVLFLSHRKKKQGSGGNVDQGNMGQRWGKTLVEKQRLLTICSNWTK